MYELAIKTWVNQADLPLGSLGFPIQPQPEGGSPGVGLVQADLTLECMDVVMRETEPHAFRLAWAHPHGGGQLPGAPRKEAPLYTSLCCVLFAIVHWPTRAQGPVQGCGKEGNKLWPFLQRTTFSISHSYSCLEEAEHSF